MNLTNKTTMRKLKKNVPNLKLYYIPDIGMEWRINNNIIIFIFILYAD